MLNLEYIKYELHDDGIGFINLNREPVNAFNLFDGVNCQAGLYSIFLLVVLYIAEINIYLICLATFVHVRIIL